MRITHICRQGLIGAGLELLVLLMCASGFAATQSAGTLTVAEGKVALVRAVALYTVAPGLALAHGDLLATDAAGEAQIEFRDGTLVNLGPATRLMVVGSGPGAPGIVLLSGWTKLAHRKSAAAFHALAPNLEMQIADANAVLRSDATGAAAFVESGAVKFSEPGRFAGVSAPEARSGEFVSRKAGQPANVSARPTADFLGAMPRRFRVDLAAQLARLAGRATEPKREHEVAYAEVEEWLKSDLPMRRQLAERFQGRLRDADFRNAVQANLRDHPEWARTLHPPKEVPKP